MVSGRGTHFWTIAKRSISESLNMSIGTYLYMNRRKVKRKTYLYLRIRACKPQNRQKPLKNVLLCRRFRYNILV